MKSRLLKVLAPVFGLAIFCLAGWALYRQLHTYRLQDILQELHSLPAARVLLAVLFAACSYLSAFIGTTFSNNLGFGLLTGGSMRLAFASPGACKLWRSASFWPLPNTQTPGQAKAHPVEPFRDELWPRCCPMPRGFTA